MIQKRVRIFNRKTNLLDTEKVHRSTWWLLGVIPIYSTEHILEYSA